MKIRQIGISDYFASDATQNLRTSGLGSCVGIVLYEKSKKIGGISHIMLPECPKDKRNVDFKKYCDTNIPIFIEKMLSFGIKKENIKAAIFGGAEMFPFRFNPIMNIGKRNVDMVIEILKTQNIPVLFQDVGGSKGRTIELDISKGEIHLRTAYETHQTFYF